MRDYLVGVYILLVILQLPLYYKLGEDALSFDFAIQDAEKRLRTALVSEQEREQVLQLIEVAEQQLKDSVDHTSRWARTALDRGVLAWKMGKAEDALGYMEESHRLFVEKHGPDSFHAAAVDLRIGELHFVRGKHTEALLRFQRSLPVVSAYLGAHTAFPVRMRFREVSCLVTLGRLGEAAQLAEPYLSQLLMVVPEQDQGFLHRTGSSLDMLSLKRLVSPPPKPHRTWKSALAEMKRASEPSLGASES